MHFLQHEEALVSMRTIKIRNGSNRDKALPFSMGNERAGKKTQQMKNFALLYDVGTVDLRQYLKSLSSFVGDFSGKKTKKNFDRDGTATIETDFANAQ